MILTILRQKKEILQSQVKVYITGMKALKGKAVTSVIVGKNVKTIGTSAFEKCSKLKTITVKNTVLKK